MLGITFTDDGIYRCEIPLSVIDMYGGGPQTCHVVANFWDNGEESQDKTGHCPIE